MFIFTKGRKEIIPTAGTLISCCIFVAVSINQIYMGRYHPNHLIFSTLPLLLVAALIKGIKLGYVMARYFFGVLAILLPLVAFNPFAYMDIEAAGGSIRLYIVGTLLAAAVAAFLFCSLGDHAKLRNLFPKK